MENSVLTTLTETVRQQAEKFSFKVRERKKVGYSKKKSFLKTFFWTPTEKSDLTTLTESIGQQAGNFSLNVRKQFLNKCFSKKISPSNFSFGFVGEGSVDYPGEIFLPGSRYILAHCPKKRKNFICQKNNSRKLSNWTSKMQF